ncbi:MAG: D-alanine--D-alanine ligase, partial [Candidatus Eremiobacteraeota bacterium]|nr:D-alanine--D-alanine ligase [Candidatus Eremiobacteraeota bacterium]
ATGRPTLLEVNALPGMTPTSLLPDEAAHAGISYEALVDRLLHYALARASEVRVG